MPSPARALIEGLSDDVLALIFTAAAAPDRLRCEQVCRRWHRILHQDDFVEHLILPHDTSDDSPSLETTPEGWSILREQVRDDSLIAASDKARGRLRTLDVSGCSEVSHNAVISVLKKNQKLAHLKMAERQADGHRLRIRPRQLVDIAHALGKRANGTPATLEASVDVAGNRELEALRDVVVDADVRTTSGSAPRVDPLVIGGTRVVISSLTLSLLFLERVLVETNDEAFDADDDADENDAEASVARETARVAATHLCEIIRAVGPRGLARVTFGERALVDGRGASRVLEALRENCGASLREIQVDGEALRQSKTRLDLTRTLHEIGRAGGAHRVTIKRAWLDGDRRGVPRLDEDTSRAEGWVSVDDGDVGTFGSEKLHLEAASARLVWNATLGRQVDAFSLAKPPDGGGRNLRSASSASTPGAFCTQHELAVSMNVITRPAETPRYFDVSNLNMRSGHLAVMLSLMDMRPARPRSRLRVLAISGNGGGDECACEGDGAKAREKHRYLGDALVRAITAHAETLHTLDIGGLPRDALSRAIGLVASLPALNVLDLSATPLGGSANEKKRRRPPEDAGPEDDAKEDDRGSKSLSRLLGDALGTPGCRLRSLVLVSCSLTAPQLRDIVSGAVKSSTVTDAVLSYNSQLGDDGCEVAARWIRGGSKKTASRVDPDARDGCLLRVSLEGCGVTDVGAKTLAAAVAENRALRRLDLAANVMIRAAGRKALADAKRGRSGIWTSETVDDTPWAGSDTESDDEFEDDDEYHSEDDGYFASHNSANAGRPSRWALLEGAG